MFEDTYDAYVSFEYIQMRTPVPPNQQDGTDWRFRVYQMRDTARYKFLLQPGSQYLLDRGPFDRGKEPLLSESAWDGFTSGWEEGLVPDKDGRIELIGEGWKPIRWRIGRNRIDDGSDEVAGFRLALHYGDSRGSRRVHCRRRPERRSNRRVK